jgi:hypothetical protein
MSTRKLQVFDQYRYGPRSVLTPGDRFRVGGGPVYVTDSGKVIPMYDRGEFVFRRFCAGRPGFNHHSLLRRRTL